jgi:hypothetical protein
MFRVALPLKLKKLETISRNKVFCMLIARGMISALIVAAFRIPSLLEGPYPAERRERDGELGQLHYLGILSWERIRHLDQEGKVVYMAKYGR